MLPGRGLSKPVARGAQWLMHPRILRPTDGEVLGPLAGVRDRFLVDSEDWEGRLAVVEHLLAPHSLAAPMHRHTREDEFSVILAGRVWFHAAGEECVAEVGDLVFKPRGEWHTFWNAGDEPARLLELITPGGLERAFRTIDTADEVDIVQIGRDYGVDMDLDATTPIIDRYGLTLG